MSNYIATGCLLLILLTQIKTSFSLPIQYEPLQNEVNFQGETYQIRQDNRILKQLRTAKQCTGNKLGLYVPYNAVKFFWSGFGVTDSEKVAAEIGQYIAAKEGKKGVTLEIALAMKENAHIKPCKWTVPVIPKCQQFWQDLSCEYATATKGEVRVILGPKLNPKGTWFTIEKPELIYRLNNKEDVSSIKQYELETVYCKDMASYNSQIPTIKRQICTKDSK